MSVCVWLCMCVCVLYVYVVYVCVVVYMCVDVLCCVYECVDIIYFASKICNNNITYMRHKIMSKIVTIHVLGNTIPIVVIGNDMKAFTDINNCTT